MSKVFQSSLFRALCAIVVGALLVKYREQTVTGITIAIGVLFLLSGLVSVMAYWAAQRRSGEPQVFDAQGRPLTSPRPAFPLVGVGSIVLGGMLALMPSAFVSGLVYVLAAILILGALSQFFTLAAAARFARIGLVWWVLPALLLIVGGVAVVKPTAIAAAPLFVIGWAMMVYGAVDLINAIKVHQCRKAYEKAQAIPEAEVVEEPAEAIEQK